MTILAERYQVVGIVIALVWFLWFTILRSPIIVYMVGVKPMSATTQLASVIVPIRDVSKGEACRVVEPMLMLRTT